MTTMTADYNSEAEENIRRFSFGLRMSGVEGFDIVRWAEWALTPCTMDHEVTQSTVCTGCMRKH